MIISAKSESRVYHMPGCRYAEMMKEENVMYKKVKWATKRKYRPCAWCFSTEGILHKEKAEVEKYLENTGYEMENRDHVLYIRGQAGFRKLVHNEESTDFTLFHGNRAVKATVEEAEAVGYHRQGDAPIHTSVLETCRYIVKHDNAKKILSMGSYRDLPRSTQKQREYYNSARKKDRIRGIRRVEDLFRQLEEGSSTKRYSVC